MNICKRDPRAGKVTTGGIVTVKDSVDNWYLSWTINRQPQFKAQDKNTVLVWLYAPEHRQARATTSKSPCATAPARRSASEWLYHIGVPGGRD